jgi:hypothetical protein
MVVDQPVQPNLEINEEMKEAPREDEVSQLQQVSIRFTETEISEKLEPHQ